MIDDRANNRFPTPLQASGGDVTLVGPFATGKAEGPCQSIDFEDSTALAVAVEDFLCRFLEAAAQP